jgi:hypothetical protein
VGRELQVRTTLGEPSPSAHAWHWAHSLYRFDAGFGADTSGLNVT